MRILMVTESLEHGGGARAVRFLANALSRENIDIHVYGVGVFLGYEKRIRLIESPGDKSMSFKFLKGFIRAAKITQPDIVHTNGMYTAMVALFVRKVFKFKYKTIMTLHHTSETFRANWIAKRLIPFLNNVDMVHYLTPYQKSIYEKFGLRPSAFRFIPNIVEIKSHDAGDVENLRKELLAKTSSKILVDFVGRLVESKQVDVFIKTIKQLRESGYPVGGVIVGTGNEEYLSGLKNLVKELSVSEHVTFIGFSTKPELYMQASDFGLFPTLTEALPLFVIESFALNKTMVVSNIPQMCGIITNQKDSLVVSEHDPEEYARCVAKLIDDNELRQKLEAGAQETYQSRYAPEKVLDQYLECYRAVLGK